MKVLTMILIALSINFSEVGRSDDGVLKASMTPYGVEFLLSVNMSNLNQADRVIIHTTNNWRIVLQDYLAAEQRNFLINSIQCSVLYEEEILYYEIESGSETFTFNATDRSFVKNRLKRKNKQTKK